MVAPVCLDLWVLKVHKVQLVNQAHLACQVLATRALLDYQEAEVHLVLQEQLVRKGSQAQLAILVRQVL